jgi:hypothetical protein
LVHLTRARNILGEADPDDVMPNVRRNAEKSARLEKLKSVFQQLANGIGIATPMPVPAMIKVLHGRERTTVRDERSFRWRVK